MDRIDLSDLLAELGDGEEAPPVTAALTDPRDLARPDYASSVVIESTGAIDFDPAFASFGARFVGLLVDAVATLVLMAPGLALVWWGRASLLGLAGLIVAAVGFAFATRLYARSVAATGKWFGNRVMSTSVVDVTTGGLLPVRDAAMRFVLRGLISPVLMFGFIVAFVDRQRRSFHDHAAGSIVIRPDRATWVVGDD